MRAGRVHRHRRAPALEASRARRARRRAARIAGRHPVMGSMKPAASPARSRPGKPHAEDSTASGPRHCGRVTRCAWAKRPLSTGSVRSLYPAGPPVARAPAHLRRRHRRSPVHPGAARPRCRSRSHVHLAELRHALDLLEIRADRPPAWSRRVAGKTKRAREPRMRAVGGNRQRASMPDARPSRPATCTPTTRDPSWTDLERERPRLSQRLRPKLRPAARSRYRAPKRPPEYTVAVAADHPDAGLAGDDHAGHRHSAVRHRADPQPAEDAERARVERIATELLAGKPCPIDQAHPRARPREHQRRNRPRRTRATDQNVRHLAPASPPSNPSNPSPSNPSNPSNP